MIEDEISYKKLIRIDLANSGGSHLLIDSTNVFYIDFAKYSTFKSLFKISDGTDK
jgi:hypothetical protein